LTKPASPSDPYAKGLELAEAGQNEEALACLQEHLMTAPNDGQALNDTGAVLYALGCFEEAAEHFKMALRHLDPPAAEALWNLAEVELAAGHPRQVMEMFSALSKAGLLNVDLINRTAKSFLDRDDAAGAIDSMLLSLRLSPLQQKVLDPIIENVRRLRPKVAMFCGAPDRQHFQAIANFVEPRFETKIFEGDSSDQMFDLMRWCDIAWFEWCTSQLAAASHHTKVCRIVAQMHHFEVFQPWPIQTRWENVDVLLTCGNTALTELLRQRAPGLAEKTRLLECPIGVDIDHLAFADRPKGKNLVCLTDLVLPRNPMLLLQCFQKLHAADGQYRLSFTGQIQDDVLEHYLHHIIAEMGLTDSVRFDGWQEDLDEYLADKHYVVSASLAEGQPVQMHEAMARGLKPVVHSFPGWRGMLPEDAVFTTTDEFCKRILDGPYRPREYRDFVADKFSLGACLAAINGVLLDLERDPLAAGQEACASRGGGEQDELQKGP
jgi:tetratricopeptide (TPR) repeat protein